MPDNRPPVKEAKGSIMALSWYSLLCKMKWAYETNMMVFHPFRQCIQQNHCFYLIEHIFFYRWGQKNTMLIKIRTLLLKGCISKPTIRYVCISM